MGSVDCHSQRERKKKKITKPNPNPLQVQSFKQQKAQTRNLILSPWPIRFGSNPNVMSAVLVELVSLPITMTCEVFGSVATYFLFCFKHIVLPAVFYLLYDLPIQEIWKDAILLDFSILPVQTDSSQTLTLWHKVKCFFCSININISL